MLFLSVRTHPRHHKIKNQTMLKKKSATGNSHGTSLEQFQVMYLFGEKRLEVSSCNWLLVSGPVWVSTTKTTSWSSSPNPPLIPASPLTQFQIVYRMFLKLFTSFGCQCWSNGPAWRKIKDWRRLQTLQDENLLEVVPYSFPLYLSKWEGYEAGRGPFIAMLFV